jgi:hypothetical protein
MIPNRPLLILPAIAVMSAISDATVRGAVEVTAGGAGVLGVFRAVFFFAAARRRAAELVVFFLVLVCDERGTAVMDARRTTANIRSLRYKIDFCSAFMSVCREQDSTGQTRIPHHNRSIFERPATTGRLLGKSGFMG